MSLSQIVDMQNYPLDDEGFLNTCKAQLDETGVLVLPGFVTSDALKAMHAESVAGHPNAYFCVQNHSVYLGPKDEAYADDHPANRLVESSKGCICDDEIAQDSPLRALYDADSFRNFVKHVTGETSLHPYADTLSSVNIHYAERGQQLGWHFDNSSFAITLLIQKPDSGGQFEFIKDLRDADAGEMNYDAVGELLDGQRTPEVLSMDPGALVLFRGRNSIHRVSPNESDTTRMLAVLAYNTEPDIALSENARMTFYGRLS